MYARAATFTRVSYHCFGWYRYLGTRVKGFVDYWSLNGLVTLRVVGPNEDALSVVVITSTCGNVGSPAYLDESKQTMMTIARRVGRRFDMRGAYLAYADG